SRTARDQRQTSRASWYRRGACGVFPARRRRLCVRPWGSLSERGEVALRPAGASCIGISREAAVGNGVAGARDELLIVGEIDLAQDHGAQHFFRPDQMMQIGP